MVSNGAIIVDVRTSAEFKAGHIPGSKNFPLDNIRTKVADLKKLNKPVITVCRSGARSGMAKGILKSAGIEVYNGGAWTSLKSKIV
ncbi:MAG: rhodanese-like domain-containing protein [Chitinophagaceae bacterium]|nr:rhodanese-like domain-containing protein [Chitinophagaceae bacterium]